MSWVPPSKAGIYDPQSRYAPRPSAAGATFTFGHLEERQRDGSSDRDGQLHATTAPPPISQRPDKASFDPPTEQLRWWQQPRSAATVSGSCNRDVEAFWQAAAQGRGSAEALVNVQARHANKAQGVGSTVAASLGDRQESDLTGQVQSLYKSDLCAGHMRVGKRGVAQPAEAMRAYEESRKQAERNKLVGRATNMQLALF